jgi:hypothetical protein
MSSDVVAGSSKEQPKTAVPGYKRVFNSVHAFDLSEKKGEDPREANQEELDPIRRELLAKAPIVEHDLDLDFWDKKSMIFNTSGLEYQHRFLGAGTGDKEISQDHLSELKKRTIVLEPQIISDIPECRFPLKNGALCPRKDIEKCPFHGKIIPRDELGRPIGEDIGQMQEEERKSTPTWQLIEKDIEKAFEQPNKRKSFVSIASKGPKQRIEKKLRKADKTSDHALLESELKARDRDAFKW